MKKRFSQFTVLELLLGTIVIVLIFLLALLVYGFFLYQNIMETKQAGLLDAEKAAVEQAALVETERVTRYHGPKKYFAVEGITTEGDEAVVFVSEGKVDQTQSFLINDIMSPEEVVSNWRNQCETCRLVDYTWAIENGIPLLEVIYISKSDRYVFEYFNLRTGETYERLPLKRSHY